MVKGIGALPLSNDMYKSNQSSNLGHMTLEAALELYLIQGNGGSNNFDQLSQAIMSFEENLESVFKAGKSLEDEQAAYTEKQHYTNSQSIKCKQEISTLRSKLSKLKKSRALKQKAISS